MEDPLSPTNINPSWSDSPENPTSALPPTPSTSTSSSTGYEREPKVFGAPGLTLVDPPSSAGGPDEGFAEGSARVQDGDRVGARKEAPNPYLRVRIGGLERNRKDLLVRFDASTNLPNFRTSLYRNIQRSYVEFQRFADQAQLCCPQTIIPALPLPSTSAVTDEEDDRLVRIALQRWFTRICEDEVLMKDDELRGFIESDFGYTPVPPPSARKNSAASAATGVFSAALSKVVRRGPLDEDDELQSAKGALDKLEERWGGAAAAVGNLGKARRALAQSNADVGAKLISLSTVESDMQLAAAERKIGRTWEHLSGMMGAQAAGENVILSDSLGYQALNARAAKEALVQRTTLLEDSQTATKAAITKRRNLERLKGSSKIDPSRVDDAIHEMREADTLETSLTKRLDAISSNLHLAIRTHSRHAHEDVAVALLEAARMSVMYHKQALREVEALKPDLARVGQAGPVPVPPVPTPSGAIASASASATTPKRANVGLPQSGYNGESSHFSGSQKRPLPPPSAAGPAGPPLGQQPRPYIPQQPQSQGAPQTPTGVVYNSRPPPPLSNVGSVGPQPPSGQMHVPAIAHGQQHFAPHPHPQSYPQKQPYPQQQQQPYSQQQYHPQLQAQQGPLSRGPGLARPPQMDGTRSMFLPPPSQVQRPHSAGPGPGQAPMLGPGHGQGYDPLAEQGPMTQSMVLPSGQPRSGAANVGRGPRRLDERQAARMLAGGF